MENILTKAKNQVERVARKVATEVKTTPEKIALGVSVMKNNSKARKAEEDIETIKRGRAVKDIPFMDPLDKEANETTRADSSNPNFRDKVAYDRVMRSVKTNTPALKGDYSPRITKLK